MNSVIKPTLQDSGNIRASCNTCNAVSIFNTVNIYEFESGTKAHRWGLMKCSNCYEGGLAHFSRSTMTHPRKLFELASFIPRRKYKTDLPSVIPDGVKKEYEEAEICFSTGANRAASALIRSVLEKTLKANGYTSGNLKNKIDEAANEGVITTVRKQKVHDDIRVIGVLEFFPRNGTKTSRSHDPLMFPEGGTFRISAILG